MSDQLSRLVEKQNKIWQRMQDIQAAAESRDDGDMTAEERTNWDDAEADLTAVSGDIERVRRSAKLAEVDYSAVVDSRGGDQGEKRDEQVDSEARYNEAFEAYVRGGVQNCSVEQRQALQHGFVNGAEVRALAAGTTTAGGYTVPTGFRAVMTEAMKAYGGLLQHANVITTESGNPLPWPTADDTGNVGAILGENTQISEQDFVFGQSQLGAYTYTSKLVRVSWQLLQDSAFSIDSYLPPRLGERIGRAWAAHLVAGTGSGQPTGLIANATVGVTASTGGTTAITYDNLVDLEHSIDPMYRSSPRTRYVMSDGALKTLRKLKDADNRPLWVPTPAPGFAPTINGYEYTIDNNMAAPAANAKPIGFGDIYAGFLVRQVRDVTLVRLGERYADLLQDGFFSFARMDARPDDANAFKVFQNSAT